MKALNSRYNQIVDNAGDIANKRLLTWIFFLVYKGLLDFIYCKYVGGIYSFFYLYYSPLSILNGWLIAAIMGMIVSDYYEQNTSSSIIMIIFNMIYFLPMTTYCAYGGGSSSFLLWGIIYWSVLSFLQLETPLLVPDNIRTIWAEGKRSVVLSIIASIPILYVWIRYAKCRLLLEYSDIYIVRAEAADYDISIVLRYLMNMLPIVVAMLIILAISQRKYILLMLLLLLVFANFSIAGHKTVLLFPFVLIGGYTLYRSKMISLMLPFGVVLEIIAILENVLGKGLIINLFFRRMGFVLAQLSEYYYRFFKNNSTDLFRQGVIGKLGFKSIYGQSIANVIGNNYETQIVNCNNGLMADVWAGLGVIGIIIMPIILIICLRLLDYASYRINRSLTIGIVVYYALLFANSQWSTVLISHGFLLMCILLILFPKEYKERMES